MPCCTFLSAYEAKKFEAVDGDKDCDDLLQEMNAKTGRLWLIQVQRRFVSRGWFKHAEEHKDYTLYLDCHGEYQVISLVTPAGSSIFYRWGNSREAVMNYMLGYLGGCPLHSSQLRGAE